MKRFVIPIIACISFLSANDQECIQEEELCVQEEELAAHEETCEPESFSTEEVCCIHTFDHRFQIGPNFTWAWVKPDGNSTTNGGLGGAQAIYEYRPLDFFYGAIVFNWRQGTTRNSPTRRSIIDVHAQERLGYTFYLPCYYSRLALFSGLGGRYMSEKVTTNNTSVRFNYVHFYVPVGINYEYEVNCFWSTGLGFQWRPDIFPTVHIVPLNGARWILAKQLDNFYLEFPFTFKIYQCFSCIVNPFFEYWNDGHTTAETGLGLPLELPDNKYYFVGLDVNLTWDF